MKARLSLLLWVLVALTACRRTANTAADGQPHRAAVYHWKTTFDPTPYERAFMARHGVSRIYIKFFDVDLDDPYFDNATPVPVATTVFRQQPDTAMDVVPVVFITVPAVTRMAADSTAMASKLVTRIEAMCKANGIGHVREVQLDCDWTKDTRDAFFALCRAVGHRLHDRHIQLSSTIRLHQLRQAPPPVDRGVLMLYNTGNFANADTRNSIIDIADVEPYRKAMQSADFALPLGFAYPAYRWTLAFSSSRNFYQIFRQDIQPDDSTFVAGEGQWLRVNRDTDVAGISLYEDFLLRRESSDYADVMPVKQLVDQTIARRQADYTNIIYHLDSANLSHYTDEEISHILR